MNKHNILSIGFNLLSYDDVITEITDWQKNGQQNYITLTPPHSVLMCHSDNLLKQATAGSGLTLPDGIGIILAAQILKYPHSGRVTGPMLMLRLCEYGRNKGWRHFFYGGKPQAVEKLTEKLQTNFPDLKIAGSYSPPFRQLTNEEDTEIVRQINDSNPDIVWVGLGSPKQEKWMANHINKIKATALIGVGAAFDFHSGTVKWAPKWMRKMGIEWVYRLVNEPKRMWKRNLNSFVFLAKIMRQKFGSSC